MKPLHSLALLILGLLASSTLAYNMDRRWAQAPVMAPTPLAPGPHPLGGLKPWLECISKAPGTITAYFGFNNPTLDDIGVPVGVNNRFVPDPPNRSQTTNFLSGRSRYFPNYAFSITIAAGAQATWQLNGYQVTASATSAECETRFVAFQMIVDAPPPLPAPSQAQVAALVTEAAIQMGTLEEQVVPSVKSVGLGKYQIVFNVTESETDGAIAPVLGVTVLFGDNVKFSAFVDKAIGVGLAPSLVEPLATGKELEGTASANTPGTAPSGPSGGPSPSTGAPGSSPSSTPSTSSPDSPPSSSTPSDSTPSGSVQPTAANTPVSSAISTFARGDVGISIMIALLLMVLLYAGCS